ncbi:MAG: hypothetical protein HWD59_01675 [Coxiellaceae bacterium]|nr:MAG: hypothetical protein HWD59_01675 [Coxiellaceae bacterium]
MHQHGLFFNLSIDATASWVTVPEDTSFVPPTGKYIAIGLTSRYRRFDSDYYEALFKNVPPEQLYFIGTETDQAARCNLHGNIFKANSFVELATFIKHASLFIGNPSFPYALAEALKVPRFVEIPPNLNVYPLDSSGKILHLLTDNYVKAEIYNYLELNDHAIKLAYDSDVALQQMNHNMQLLQQKLALLQNSKIVRPAIYLLKITMLIKIICRKSLTLLKILKSKFKNMLGMIKRPLT